MSIDTNRLIRDYHKNPLTKGSPGHPTERPEKEDLTYLYLELNMSKDDLAKFLGVKKTLTASFLRELGVKKSKELEQKSREQSLLNKYGVKNISCIDSVKVKKEETCLRNFGVTNPSQSDVVEGRKAATIRTKKLKASLLKAEQTCLARYGETSASKVKEVKRKTQATNLKKYGVPYTLQADSVRKKSKATCIEKYGSEYAMENPIIARKSRESFVKNNNRASFLNDPDVRQKIEATNLKKYGVKNIIIYPEIVEKVKKERLQKYGVEHSAQEHFSDFTKDTLLNKDNFKTFLSHNSGKNTQELARLLQVHLFTFWRYVHLYKVEAMIFFPASSYEQEIKELFPTITFRKDRTILDGLEIDLYSEEHKIGIEFNGNYWHSDKFISQNYHQEKTARALDKGIFIYHIFEWEWNSLETRQAIISQLRNLLSLNKDTVYARKCSIQTVSNSEAAQFLKGNHTFGSGQPSNNFGLYHNNELVALMSMYSNPINKNYQYELHRFCSKAGTNVVGGASKLFKHAIAALKSESIISYSDRAKTTGNLYKTLGFTQKHITRPQYHWIKGNTVLSRYQTQLKKLKKLGWLSIDETENSCMKRHGFNKVYDCGKISWVWKHNK